MSFLWFSKKQWRRLKERPSPKAPRAAIQRFCYRFFSTDAGEDVFLCSFLLDPPVANCPQIKVVQSYRLFQVRFSPVLQDLGWGLCSNGAASWPHLTWCVPPPPHWDGTQFALKPKRSLSLHTLEVHFCLPCFICNANGRRQLPSCMSVLNPKPRVGGGGKEEEKINKTAG